MIAGSQTITGDRRRSHKIEHDHDRRIAEVCFHMIAHDRRTFCDLRSAIICDHLETSVISGELKQTRRRRKRDRHLKMSLRVSGIIFQLFKVIMPEKCALNILELNWNQRLGQDKIEHSSSYAHVVHTTAKKRISRRRKNENVFKMSILCKHEFKLKL